jgi:hypothetical protein
LYGHGSWSLTLRVELGLKLFMIREMGKIVWPKWVEVTGNGGHLVYIIPSSYW